MCEFWQLIKQLLDIVLAPAVMMLLSFVRLHAKGKINIFAAHTLDHWSK